MTNKRNLNVAKWLVGSALVMVGSSAMADWSFASGVTGTPSGTTITSTATAMSTTGSGSVFATATANSYAGGIGVESRMFGRALEYTWRQLLLRRSN